LIQEWRPLQLVCGLPFSMDGTEHDMTRRARRFANQLNGRFALPVTLVDERLTSFDADLRLREAGVKGSARKGLDDASPRNKFFRTFLIMPKQLPSPEQLIDLLAEQIKPHIHRIARWSAFIPAASGSWMRWPNASASTSRAACSTSRFIATIFRASACIRKPSRRTCRSMSKTEIFC
jgi:hypothetical protein